MCNLVFSDMNVDFEGKTSKKGEDCEKERDKRMRDEDHEKNAESGENVRESWEFRKLIFIFDEIEMENNKHDIKSHTYTGHIYRVEISKT